jgi:DNA-binding HxlR family transcriptional regulator
MVMALSAHRDYVRILSSIRRKPKRFSQLQKEPGLNLAQVDRALKFLRKALFIVPRIEPSTKGRIRVEYEVGNKGGGIPSLVRHVRAFAPSRTSLARTALPPPGEGQPLPERGPGIPA